LNPSNSKIGEGTKNPRVLLDNENGYASIRGLLLRYGLQRGTFDLYLEMGRGLKVEAKLCGILF